MTANEWLKLIQKASDYNTDMTPLIIKYGEMLVSEKCEDLIKQKLKRKIKIMKAIKFVGILLAVLLVLFMLVGMYYGGLIFFSVIKLIAVASIITSVIFLYFKYKK